MPQANAGNNNANNAGAKHPNGRAKIAIKDVQRVHGHVEEIPLQAYRDANVNVNRGWNTLVTADEVRDASDAYDARSILQDIDTQWGILPHGGAYKESNHYFGPGMYDFY